MSGLLHVRTVYGDTLLIADSDYWGERVLIPLRLPDGRRIDAKPGRATALHRDNIAAVFPLR